MLIKLYIYLIKNAEKNNNTVQLKSQNKTKQTKKTAFI